MVFVAAIQDGTIGNETILFLKFADRCGAIDGAAGPQIERSMP
jgi:hypothetical protein